MIPLTLLPRPGDACRVLLLGAHADDIEIGCGGTILTWLDGCPDLDVHWVVFATEGEREREARSSARQFLRAARRATVVTKSFKDGFLPYVGAEIKGVFEDLSRKVSPDVIFTHHREDRHQDHRVISELTWNTFRDHLILEYEIPKYDGDLGSPNCFTALDKTTCRRKVAYLRSAFKTQAAKPWFASETFLGLMRLRGMESRSAYGYAEGFYVRKLRLTVQPRSLTGRSRRPKGRAPVRA